MWPALLAASIAARLIYHAGALDLRLPPGHHLLEKILARLRALPTTPGTHSPEATLGPTPCPKPRKHTPEDQQQKRRSSYPATRGFGSEQWWAAFLAVPREVFIPEVIWRYAGDDLVALRRGDEPQEWLGRVYGPRYVVTQVDDGTPAGPQERGRMATSSASRPDIVALMLDTGYTAALLAERLGARNVTGIEIDPALAARARTALATAGYGDVTVITGDGAQGHPDRAPFDRVLSTVAAPRVPYAWVARTRRGGLVLTPWGSAYKPAGLLSLTVRTNGAATGGLVNTTISFMELRDQRIARAAITDLVRDADTADLSHTDLHASRLCNDNNALFAIAIQVPGCHWEHKPTASDDHHWCVWFLDPGSGSWARFDYQPETRRWPIHQFGPRQLWDEVTAAYQRWEHAGRPAVTQWRFTITPDGQQMELTDATPSGQ
jgi:protein-L-isoaspartate O-methyltransferase